jgi:pSer/pThr/pTyr-binding forkhead associated (FHA) protein
MDVNLILFRKDGATMRLDLPSAVTSIGRYRGCDLCIPSTIVSRKHCELYLYQGRLMVRDLSSRNGTLLNGEKVDEAIVHAGDVLEIGPVVMGVQIDGVPEHVEAVRPETRATETLPREPQPVEKGEDAFETMIKDLASDFDLNQTMNANDAVDAL